MPTPQPDPAATLAEELRERSVECSSGECNRLILRAADLLLRAADLLASQARDLAHTKALLREAKACLDGDGDPVADAVVLRIREALGEIKVHRPLTAPAHSDGMKSGGEKLL